MARRRKEGEEPTSRRFQFPEFDEKEMIRKEVISFRSSLVVLAWAFLVALVSFTVWLFMPSPRVGWYVGLGVMAGLGYLLRYVLPLVKVDIAHFGKKEWFGSGALYFFAWLAFFVLVVNPPIYDGVPPDIEVHLTPTAQVPGQPVNVTVITADNHRVDPDSLRFTLTAPDGRVIATAADLARTAHPTIWTYRFTPTEPGDHVIEARIADFRAGLVPSGPHHNEYHTRLVAGDVLTVRMTGEGNWRTPEDRVTVEVPATVDVHRAWLQLANGTLVLLAQDLERSDDERLAFYARPDFEGFAGGQNNFTVRIEEHAAYFFARKYGIGEIDAPLVSAESHTVTIDAALLGTHRPEAIPEREHTVQPIPGPGVLLLAALLGLALFVGRRRRRRHR